MVINKKKQNIPIFKVSKIPYGVKYYLVKIILRTPCLIILSHFM